MILNLGYFNHLTTLTFSVFTGLHDLEYQNTTTLVSASWHGYIDLESYIDHYVWCVGTDMDDPNEADLVACVPVGLRLSAYKHLETPLNHGMKLSPHLIYYVIIITGCHRQMNARDA